MTIAHVPSLRSPSPGFALPLRGRWLRYAAGWGLLLAPFLVLYCGIMNLRVVPSWCFVANSPVVALGPMALGLLLILRTKGWLRMEQAAIGATFVALLASVLCGGLALDSALTHPPAGTVLICGNGRDGMVADLYFHPAVLLLTVIGSAVIARPERWLGPFLRLPGITAALLWAFALCYTHFGRG